jgi:lipopolysaccharide transport system ATP-binding protein
MSDVVLKVEGLSKKFCMSLKRSMLYGTYDVARDMLGFPKKNSMLRTSEFWALQDINFELKRGETLGLIGQNGCGKTTLLRLLNGIFPPDKGRITINGRIGALIAVGAGFHPHMTGRENIYLNGAILGMTKAEIKLKFDSIVDFAEIGEFIDAPVATYSSGMTVRLGFAIAIHCEPDIMLIDEILAVGDATFQMKCMDMILKMQQNESVSLLFVSHNITQVNRLCQHGILLDHGKQIFTGTSIDAGIAYVNLINSLPEKSNIKEKPLNDMFKGKIKSARCYSLEEFDQIMYKGSFCVEILFSASTIVENAEVRLAIAYPNKSQYLAFQSSHVSENDFLHIREGEYLIKFNIIDPNLLPNNYVVHFSLANRENIYLFGDFNVCQFKIVNNPLYKLMFDDFSGIVKLNSKVEIINND